MRLLTPIRKNPWKLRNLRLRSTNGRIHAIKPLPLDRVVNSRNLLASPYKRVKATLNLRWRKGDCLTTSRRPKNPPVSKIRKYRANTMLKMTLMLLTSNWFSKAGSLIHQSKWKKIRSLAVVVAARVTNLGWQRNIKLRVVRLLEEWLLCNKMKLAGGLCLYELKKLKGRL
jgi:hypothetical protein